MKLPPLSIPVALAGSALFTACGVSSGDGGDGQGGDAATFDFATTRDVSLGVTVTVDGSPAEGAVVRILDVLRPVPGVPIEDVTLGGQYATARSGADGVARGDFRMPTRIDEVDVVVTLPGTTGPISESGLRELWGPFAPAARVHVLPSHLDDLVIALTEVTQ